MVEQAEFAVLARRLGDRVKRFRARRGMSRKDLSNHAGISERYLAQLEGGQANVSVNILWLLAQAMDTPITEMIEAEAEACHPDLPLAKKFLDQLTPEQQSEAYVLLRQNFKRGLKLKRRVALIGLRGAGKSTLGQMLADDLGYPFVELSREIEKFAGCSIAEIQALYGQSAYRRYERRALEEAIQIYPEAVIATPGGLVSDAATFNLLLAHCTTVWLQASPEDHMARVRAQGDLRPMAASAEAMDDLRQILAGRAAFYSKADLTVDTSAAPLEPTFQRLRQRVREALALPA